MTQSFRPNEVTCDVKFTSHDIKNFPKKIITTTYHPHKEVKEYNLIDIIVSSTFYYPASQHYGNNDSTIVCDVCYTDSIKACFGYNKFDICLKCANIIIESANIE